MAGAYFFNRNHELAAEAYGILLKDMPQRADLLALVHYWRGRSLLGKEDYPGARQAFAACLDAGDLSHLRHESPHLYAGQSAVMTAAFEAALPFLDTHLAGTIDSPSKGQGLLWKSRALRGLGRKEAALAAIQGSAEVYMKTYGASPRSLPRAVLLQRAECWADAADRAQALKDLDEILKGDAPLFYEDSMRLKIQASALREKLPPAPLSPPAPNALPKGKKRSGVAKGSM